ncbi:hypothetical protein GDO78_000187 [Eleutherodactylus coqui]|uniref:Uncharacterized protein n=1 Tax=Eleutherodactylus coqui TaxID=57060 RepID=A0A8J6KFY2_ELECQ|nr:hypothetical protein GDO78_000187 [Eleutherodactylus coqui]
MQLYKLPGYFTYVVTMARTKYIGGRDLCPRALGCSGSVVREQSSVAACFCVCDNKLKTLYVTRVHLSLNEPSFSECLITLVCGADVL